ncbi:MAG: AAA family ATPase [Clostridia bacterium]|nr:AAA family ATPase [Clostridia bacterium]
MVSFIGITSGSGGMGKSSSACNIALALSAMGKKVLLIECEFGIRSHDAILGVRPETFSSFSDYCNNNADLTDIITKPEKSKIPHFITGGIKSPEGDITKALISLKAELSGEYDFIVSDVSPLNERVFEAFKIACDTFLVLTDDSFISLRNSSFVVNSIKETSKAKIFGVLNKVVIDGKEGSHYAEDIADEMGASLIGIIPFDEHFSYSIENGLPIYKYNTYSGRAYENISKRLVGQAVPDYETGNGGFFNKNKFVLKYSI